MRVVLVGRGGRENALAWRIARSPSLERLTVTGPNPGWPRNVDVRPAEGVPATVALIRELGPDLVVVGPEGPLAEGLADAVTALGVPCFGPSRAAARLETSKSFAKEVMTAVGVPTASAVLVDTGDPGDLERARARCAQGNVVLKADGLAAGKGVVVCETADEALSALDGMVRFGDAARRLVLEDRLEGPEVSVFALSDGERVVALPSAQDHKQLLDGGHGPMTGGMGAYAPCPLVDRAQASAIVEQVHGPVVREMARRGTPFRGVLFAGLMLTRTGPVTLEFNVRFGDPECQPLMALWEDDPLPWLHGAAIGRLPSGEPRFVDGTACCVVLAARGYPDAPERGIRIPEPPPTDGVVVFHAGTVRGDDGVLRTAGGRVLGVTGIGHDLPSARARAYGAVPGWRFDGAAVRTDIGGLG